MTTSRIIILAIAAAALSLGAIPAEAAKGDRKANRGAARMLSRFDRDSSGSLDTSEAERARRLFAALKTLDTDKDGAISDSEASSAKLGKDGRRKGRKGTR